ncbi:hypothetical protein ABIE26_004160 [Pedobacter africanus]|uniref:Uncharacterized protein n=1 Tax=Pedobacter africanus TaxID=151894 RepID=A0ACC6L204_9SPHI|nr:hypothetical protein [Pedobacter africanus]
MNYTGFVFVGCFALEQNEQLVKQCILPQKVTFTYRVKYREF